MVREERRKKEDPNLTSAIAAAFNEPTMALDRSTMLAYASHLR